tara:strand:+ start:126 stop:485 length:360 start_codon:yes stop_codon:yes gene_type:complete
MGTAWALALVIGAVVCGLTVALVWTRKALTATQNARTRFFREAQALEAKAQEARADADMLSEGTYALANYAKGIAVLHWGRHHEVVDYLQEHYQLWSHEARRTPYPHRAPALVGRRHDC